MKRIAYIISLATAIVLLASAPAQATSIPSPERLSTQIARDYWGRSLPCRLTLRVDPAADVDAVVRTSAFAYTIRNQCLIVISQATVDQASFAWRCQVVAHEYGHVLGYDHSADPHSLMSPEGGIDAITPCVRNEVRLERACRRKHTKRARAQCRKKWGVY